MGGRVVMTSWTWGARNPMPAAAGAPATSASPPVIPTLADPSPGAPLPYAFLGWRLPSTSFSQVPLGTYTQASPCLSRLEVPAQDELAVWQSFLAALTMPKHFSCSNFGTGAGPACALVRSGRENAVATAVVMSTRVGFIERLLLATGEWEVSGHEGLNLAP